MTLAEIAAEQRAILREPHSDFRTFRLQELDRLALKLREPRGEVVSLPSKSAKSYRWRAKRDIDLAG